MVRALKRAGFVPAGRRGSHVKLRSAEGRTVIVPLHPELAIGTLASILRQAGMSIDDLLEHLDRLVLPASHRPGPGLPALESSPRPSSGDR